MYKLLYALTAGAAALIFASGLSFAADKSRPTEEPPRASENQPGDPAPERPWKREPDLAHRRSSPDSIATPIDNANSASPAGNVRDQRPATHSPPAPSPQPIAKMNGVAKLFTHYDGYRRAEQISGGSRYWGLTFCVGTWSEGGSAMGKNVFEMIGDFGGRGKILEVHLRNVSGPLPHFVETLPDDGYMNVYEVMKALRRVGFDGAVEPDHVQKLGGDTGSTRAGTAYCIAYMRALLD